MEAIPWGFKSPLSHCLGLVLFVFGCAESLEESAGRLRAAIEASPREVSQEVLDRLTPESANFLREAQVQGIAPDILAQVLRVLKVARPVPGEPGLLAGPSPTETLFFVRDGWIWRLDLALSGVLFHRNLETTYPPPW